MKVWKWYRNYSDEELKDIKNISIDEKYPLYAVTNNKKFRDEFRMMRKKDCFIEKVDEIDESEWTNIANSCNANVLSRYPYSKFVRRVGLHEEMEDIWLVTTWEERNTVSNNCDYDAINVNTTLFREMNPYPLNQKIADALNKLEYFSLWKLLSEEYSIHELQNILQVFGIDDDYSEPNIVFDEFRTFIVIYQDVLAIDDSEAMI